MERIMIVVATVTTLDIRHVLLLYNVKAQCLIPYILLFSKPQLQAAPQCYRHGVTLHLRPHRVGRAPHHCMRVAAKLCEFSCCRDPASHSLSVLSHCLVKRNIFVVKILLNSVLARFSSCTAEVTFRHQSPEDVVARPFS